MVSTDFDLESKFSKFLFPAVVQNYYSKVRPQNIMGFLFFVFLFCLYPEDLFSFSFFVFSVYRSKVKYTSLIPWYIGLYSKRLFATHLNPSPLPALACSACSFSSEICERKCGLTV